MRWQAYVYISAEQLQYAPTIVWDRDMTEKHYKKHWVKASPTYALYWETQDNSRWGKSSKPMRQVLRVYQKIKCINQVLIQGKSSYVCTHDFGRPSKRDSQPMSMYGHKLNKMQFGVSANSNTACIHYSVRQRHRRNRKCKYKDETSDAYTNSVKGGRNS